MGLANRERILHTVEDYLRNERESFERHEYLDGEIYQMAGESIEHGDISTNLTREISIQLKGTPCRIHSKDMKVVSGVKPELARTTRGMFSYPDAVVVCGEVKTHDARRDIITNPKVIFEILSESTAEFDRGEKFMRYRNWNETLTDYVLISQDRPVVEHFIRLDDDNWNYRVYRGLNDVLRIDSINCELSLTELFDRVEFDDSFDEFTG